MLPVNCKLLHTIGAFYLRLPTDIRPCGPYHVNAVVLTAADEQGRIHVGGIDQVLLGSEVFVDERLLDLLLPRPEVPKPVPAPAAAAAPAASGDRNVFVVSPTGG